MDEKLFQLITAGDSPEAQKLLLPYFEELKTTDQGWQTCGDILARNTYEDERVRFFCLQVLESHIRNRYVSLTEEQRDSLRNFMEHWYKHCCSSSSKNFIRNKTAQLYCLVFVHEYPKKWLNIFSDMLNILSMGAEAVDIYLRVLIAIDEEVVARHIPHTQQDLDRNTGIKDHMRDHCIKDLVDSWYSILKMYEQSNTGLVCTCLQVIGAYISWIDINLIANDKFISCLLSYLSNELIRESACECFLEIINKGMSASDKTRLIESLCGALEETGVLATDNQDLDYDGEFPTKLSALMNGMGVQLIASYNKLTKEEIDGGVRDEILKAMEGKIPHMLRFLADDDDDVSEACFEFCHDYINLLKIFPADVLENNYKERLRNILLVVVRKMKYDEDYNFEKEDDSEVEFLEYRKQMKILMDNIAKVDRNLFVSALHSLIIGTLQNWQNSSFLEVELAIYMLYLMGEAIPGQTLFTDAPLFAAFQEMMTLLITSEVSHHEHYVVQLQYFETVTRYERFFYAQTQHIPTVLMSFLDERGLCNTRAAVSSRTSFLLMRFIKALKMQITPYVGEILKRLQVLLGVEKNGVVMSLSENDMYYLYEVAAVLIQCSSASQENQLTMMRDLLSPVMVRFQHLLDQMRTGQLDEVGMLEAATQLQHLMSYASRASKAFSTTQSLKVSGCAQCFTEVLSLFLNSLTIPVHREIIHNGVRQYLHRMIICLGDEVLPFVPATVTHLLKDCEMRDVQEFIPLINQLIARFKDQLAPFLSEIFMPLITQVFVFIQAPIEENDLQGLKERQLLHRSYFLFISTIVNHNITQVLTSQDANNLKEILLSIRHGAVEIPDAQGQKTCFVIFNKLIDVWGSNNSSTDFRDFIYESILPSCFMAPLKQTFDLEDAQTMLVLHEIALTQKNILEKRGVEAIEFLRTQFLPQNSCPPDVTDEYCHALQNMNNKSFKNYLRAFYGRFKT